MLGLPLDTWAVAFLQGQSWPRLLVTFLSQLSFSSLVSISSVPLIFSFSLSISLKLNLFVLPSKWRLLLPQTISVLYNKKRYSSFFIKNNFLLLLEHIVSVPETKGKTRREREGERERDSQERCEIKTCTNWKQMLNWTHVGDTRVEEEATNAAWNKIVCMDLNFLTVAA